MADDAVFAGAALRRLRRKEGMTQAAMAERIGISPSYLNLIERNQRPLTARVMMQVVDRFDFDPRGFREDESIGGVAGLVRRFQDERFADLGIDRDDIAEFLSQAPQAAAAFARLYDTSGEGGIVGTDPLDEARREIERWRNHFPDLDRDAEELADELRLSRGDIGVALTERLRDKHQLAVRILPREVMPDLLRRLDLHARQLQINEMLPPSARNFQVATQLAQLEKRDEIASIARGPDISDDAARALFERHLTGYFAAALIMPYSRFLRACDATGYDLTVLQRRFGVSFEQLAHRLTTLQRVGQRGLPFFMARIDRAGQFSKRFVGASGTTLLDSDTSCPFWNVHQAFEQPDRLQVQQIELAGSDAAPSHWFTLARSITAADGAEGARFSVVVGIEARLAGELAHARGVDLDPARAQPVGLGCARCFRENCRQRSLPPRATALHFDPVTRSVAPFSFGSR